jgi:hypothetical protein
VGIVRGVGPEQIDPRGVYDQIDGLYEADGAAFARGGTSGITDALSTPASNPTPWVFDGYFDAGERTVFASDDDFYVVDSDGHTPINLGSDGMLVPKPSALIESMLFIGGGYIYGGSRKTANYTTGTVTFTNGSKTVTGSGTTWNTLVDAGMLIQRGNERVYVVASVDSTTQLTLRDAYEGSHGIRGQLHAQPDLQDHGRRPLRVGRVLRRGCEPAAHRLWQHRSSSPRSRSPTSGR